MSTTPFRPGPCTAATFPPRPCCDAPREPWPARFALAPALERGQWRRATDGTDRFCHVLSIGAWWPETMEIRCEVELYDVDSRHVTNVRSVWGMALIYPEVLAAPPPFHEVTSGEHRRTEGGLLVEVTTRDVFGEYRLRAAEGTTAEETAQIQGRTYSPREIVRLYPDKLGDLEVLELQTRQRERADPLVGRRVVLGGGRRGSAVLAATMVAMLSLNVGGGRRDG